MNAHELYESGKMPERYYSALNDKTAFENYKRQKLKLKKKRKDESLIMALVESSLQAAVKVALDEIFKDFGKSK